MAGGSGGHAAADRLSAAISVLLGEDRTKPRLLSVVANGGGSAQAAAMTLSVWSRLEDACDLGQIGGRDSGSSSSGWYAMDTVPGGVLHPDVLSRNRRVHGLRALHSP